MNKHSNPVINFLRGKGFYLILAVCIVTAAGCSFVAIRNMMNELNQEAGSSPETGGNTWNLQPTTPDLPEATVDNKASSVPKPSPSSKPVESAAPSSAGSSSVASSQPDSTVSAEPQEPVDAPVPSFAQPVSGQILYGFSGDELVFNETLGDWRTHNGTDIAAKTGEEVKNAMAGTVTKAAEEGTWGGVVEVNCGDVTLRYAGLALPLQVKEGDAVAVGQLLGKISEVPCENGLEAHLHLEATKDGAYVDPAQWLQQNG